MTLQEVPDKVLADMVRNGCYSRNTNLDNGTRLLLLAVPYSMAEAETDAGAFEEFRELLTADDWDERNIQVLTVRAQPLVTPGDTAFVVRELSYEAICHVDCSDCGVEVDREDRFFATPCGTFCDSCMHGHMRGCGICAAEFS